MVKRITILWVLVLVTLVPYSAYYLLFEAQRDEYALLITFILFWIFGFWGVAGPLISAIKIRRVFKMLETVQTKQQFLDIINKKESEEAAIEFIATENKIPKFIASKVYSRLVKQLNEKQGVQPETKQ